MSTSFCIESLATYFDPDSDRIENNRKGCRTNKMASDLSELIETSFLGGCRNISINFIAVNLDFKWMCMSRTTPLTQQTHKQHNKHNNSNTSTQTQMHTKRTQYTRTALLQFRKYQPLQDKRTHNTPQISESKPHSY